MQPARRDFLADVGRGMLAVSVGPALATELAGKPSERPSERLHFGKQEALVSLLQETPPDKLLPLLVTRIGSGTSLASLTAACALANARAFGGEDYVGYHTLMALSPALAMSGELAGSAKALPVLKVLHRHSRRLEERGSHADTLTPIDRTAAPAAASDARGLRAAVHARDLRKAEATFANLTTGQPEDAYNALLPVVHDSTDVHRVVLAYRSWDLLDLVGREHAREMLRQSVRYCVKAENWKRQVGHGDPREVLPRLLDEFRLVGKPTGKRTLDDAALGRLSQAIFESTPQQAAGIAAQALADGIAPDIVGEAVTLAACELVLRDTGRPMGQASATKPVGSIHGDSIGVHASDSANAWRNIARVANARNASASLILAAFQVALDRVERGGDFLAWKPYPLPEHLTRVKGTTPEALLVELAGAVKDRDQALAAGCTAKLLTLGKEREVKTLFLDCATRDDGALHAEKYYRTATEEYGRTRTGFRGRHLIALARVTASAAGLAAPGHTQACKLLKV